ncbi:LytR family transcriptional regulator [Streptomyces daqingensis]|uniref:LytR family transcriptional regulator n=1 Tax=Streptomyces daqingensis TaxID=1472640 RepID=A0ABQ2LV29_9ACTN|nr:LCP family protein [Streptomyces daqingensis]GGO43447.1 LytR family transcriptional regulator [Streptomyces daqingensis]
MSSLPRNPRHRPFRPYRRAREESGARPAHAGAGRLPAHSRRAVALAGVLCAALTCGAALAPDPSGGRGGADGGEEKVRDAVSGLPKAGRPKDRPGTNILLVGLDRRDGIDKATRDRLHVNGQQCDCTDTMMLVHISADRERVSVVSIPRDSYVRFAPHRDTGKGFGKVKGGTTRHLGKINSAFAHGGPGLAVRTVEAATGVRVDHYAETDFVGFEKAVDRLGGAKVCTDKPLQDKNAGLKLAKGTHVLDGNRTLRYVRARHLDPPGDVARVRRQQHVLGELLRTLAGERFAGNPVELARAAHSLRKAVRTDSTLTMRRIVGIARSIRGLEADQTEFATVPIGDFDHRSPVWGSTLRWDGPRARALFADLAADRPITGNPATGPKPGSTPVPYAPETVKVRVEGSGKAAERMAQDLRDNGFAVQVADGAKGGPRKGRTEITYDPYWQRKASTIAAALPGAELRPVPVRGDKHDEVFTVRPGTEGAAVADVDFDRSHVEGGPVNGEELDCDEDD